MTHNEMIRSIAQDTDQPMVVVDDIVRVLFRLVAEELRTTSEVSLINLGKLKVKQNPARMGRNPRTGAEVPIPARRSVRFKASVRLEL